MLRDLQDKHQQEAKEAARELRRAEVEKLAARVELASVLAAQRQCERNLELARAQQAEAERELDRLRLVARGVFTLADQDGDGTINLHEMGTALRHAGSDLSHRALRDLASEVGVSGSIDFPLFLSLLMRAGQLWHAA